MNKGWSGDSTEEPIPRAKLNKGEAEGEATAGVGGEAA